MYHCPQVWIGLSFDPILSFWYNQDQSAVSYLGGSSLLYRKPTEGNCVLLKGNDPTMEMDIEVCDSQNYFICERPRKKGL